MKRIPIAPGLAMAVTRVVAMTTPLRESVSDEPMTSNPITPTPPGAGPEPMSCQPPPVCAVCRGMQGRRDREPPLPSRRLRCLSPRILSIFNERKCRLDAVQGIEKIGVAPLEVFNGCFDFRESENGKTRSISNRFFHNLPPHWPWPRRAVAALSSGRNPNRRPMKSVAT